jgi:hypothetical protein
MDRGALIDVSRGDAPVEDVVVMAVSRRDRALVVVRGHGWLIVTLGAALAGLVGAAVATGLMRDLAVLPLLAALYGSWRTIVPRRAVERAALRVLRPEANDAEVRRILRVLAFCRRRNRDLFLLTDGAYRPLSRRRDDAWDEDALLTALIDDVTRHRGEPARGRPGDREWGAYNARLVAARKTYDNKQQGKGR